jgi:hypothetical protein
MSYGFLVETDAGKLLVVDDYLIPWFVGKGTAGSQGAFFDSGGDHERSIVAFSIPGSGQRMLAWTIPVDSNAVWYQLPSNLDSGSSINMFCYRAVGSGLSYTTPECYVFDMDTAPTASGGYGMQVFKADGSLIMDSGSPPFSAHSIITHTIPTTGATTSGLPAKPGFVVPQLDKDVLTSTGALTSDLEAYAGVYRRPTSTTLSSDQKWYHFEGVDSGTTVTVQRGVLSGQSIAVINAANYD